MLTTALELSCVLLLSLFAFAVWPPAALVPWAGAAGLAAYVRYPKRERHRR